MAEIKVALETNKKERKEIERRLEIIRDQCQHPDSTSEGWSDPYCTCPDCDKTWDQRDDDAIMSKRGGTRNGRG